MVNNCSRWWLISVPLYEQGCLRVRCTAQCATMGLTLILAGIAAVLAALAWRIVRGGGAVLPLVGSAAPDFELPDQRGVMRRSREFRGRWLVLYFYPRDETPGCTRQAICFRDAHGEFTARGIAVCGISVDDPASHARFAEKHRLPFVLLADRKGRVAARYGSLIDFGIVKFARRNAFVIDPNGVLVGIHRGVDPAASAERVLQDVRM